MPQLRDDYNICRTWLTADKSPCRRRILHCNDYSCAWTQYSLFWISSQRRRFMDYLIAGSPKIIGLFHEFYHFGNFLDMSLPAVHFYYRKRPAFKLDLYFLPDVCCIGTLFHCFFNWIYYIQTSYRALLAKYPNSRDFYICSLAVRL